MALRRNLLLLATLAAGGLAMVILVGFVWPDEPFPRYPDTLNLGPGDQYEVGSATRVPAPGDYDTSRWPTVRTEIASDRVHQAGMWLVRLEDGSIRVLLARAPFEGCTVPWRETREYAGRVGWFANPCHRAFYNLDGRWMAEGSRRDMDWFAVHIDRDGNVIVDLTTLHPGETHHGVPADERPIPTAEGWSAPCDAHCSP